MGVRAVTTKEQVRDAVREHRAAAASGSVGLVPTMGYLHEGHLSLVRRARRENGLVVVSIFVNPTQFSPGEDLESYPRDFERDLGLAGAAGADVVFHPSVEEMYARDHCTWVEVENLTERLCGASRPGHFRGVTTVVAKLFGIVAPDTAYFGQKDAQQALVIRRMVDDLDMNVTIEVCPTVRESDGLAMSSRNNYLSSDERRQAPTLRQALVEATSAIERGESDPRAVEEAFKARLAEAPLARLDYLEIAGASDLAPLVTIHGEVLVAAAVWFGTTRLIDNMMAVSPD